MTPVLDMVRYRLQKEVSRQSDPYLAAAQEELVQLYDAGIVLADLKDGEIMLSLSDRALEALETGGLTELLAARLKADAEHVGPLNVGPPG